MKKTILLLMGASGCGKSTLEKQLLADGDVHRAVSTVTREMRKGEKDGVSYHFVNHPTFNTMLEESRFIQVTKFGGNSYGTTKSEYATPEPITVLSITPKSAVDFIPTIRETFPDYDIKIVYFDISFARLRKNMAARGDTPEQIESRILHDDLVEQFILSGFKPDLKITDDDIKYNLSTHVRKELGI